jgi:hypothetical protein
MEMINTGRRQSPRPSRVPSSRETSSTCRALVFYLQAFFRVETSKSEHAADTPQATTLVCAQLRSEQIQRWMIGITDSLRIVPSMQYWSLTGTSGKRYICSWTRSVPKERWPAQRSNTIQKIQQERLSKFLGMLSIYT